MQGAPGAHIIAGRAVLFGLAGSEGFRELMQAVVRGAEALAASLKAAGLFLYLGGTDTHMVILDLRGREIDGRVAERRLERHGLIANRVTLPERPGRPDRVGIRFGSTAMATRGMREEGFAAIGSLIARVLWQPTSTTLRSRSDPVKLHPLARSPPRSAASRQCPKGAINAATQARFSRRAAEGPQGYRRGHHDRWPARRDPLADFGADVIKIEQPGEGDSMRHWAPVKEGKSLWWKVIARNKRLLLPLVYRRRKDRNSSSSLSSTPTSSSRTTGPERSSAWGLGYDELARLNPKIIFVRVSGFGQTGPYSHRGGYGTVAECFSGAPSFTGFPDRPPTLPGFPLAGLTAATFAAMAAMFAVFHRDQDGGAGRSST